MVYVLKSDRLADSYQSAQDAEDGLLDRPRVFASLQAAQDAAWRVAQQAAEDNGAMIDEPEWVEGDGFWAWCCDVEVPGAWSVTTMYVVHSVVVES